MVVYTFFPKIYLKYGLVIGNRTAIMFTYIPQSILTDDQKGPINGTFALFDTKKEV